MNFGYTIIYVEDVKKTVSFYETAFSLKRRFIDESAQYAEMETGQTTLAFASHELAKKNVPSGIQMQVPHGLPGPVEIVFTTHDVSAAFSRAVEAGAVMVSEPQKKPWGQSVAYVRDLDGNLVEIAGTIQDSQPSKPNHVLTILAVSDLRQSARFYKEAFDWDVQVEVPVYLEFGLPGGRRLGLYQREGFSKNTGQSPQVVPNGGISGTEIYLHCDDLTEAIRRLEAAGARKLSARAGRDWGDEAAYYADPDGNVITVAHPMVGGQ